MASRPGTTGRLRPRRPARAASPLSARFAGAAAAAVIAVLGGGAAAAYTGSLPGALQKIAHKTIAAPDVRKSPAALTVQGSDRPTGPSVPGAAAYGLCNAYQHAETNGTASQRAVAFRNLVQAAGGADMVAAYCASVPHPGPTSPPGRRVGQTSSSANPGRGQKPTAPPGRQTASPGKPSTPPGKPSTPPGKPSTPPDKPTNSPGNGNGR